MKHRLVEHIVFVTLQRRKTVFAVTVVLCALSALFTATLLESDLTFKGMIGQAAPPVRAYDKIIRDFKVSGVITVALEPLDSEERKITLLRGQIDALIFETLDSRARASLLDILKESSAEEMTTLEERDHLLTMVDLFRLLGPGQRAAALVTSPRLPERDRRFLLDHATNSDAQNRRAVYRKFQKLGRDNLSRLAAATAGLSPAHEQTLARAILSRMSAYSKQGFVEQLETLSAEKKAQVLARVEQLDVQIDGVLAGFKASALKFADQLKQTLRDDAPLPGTPEAPSAVVRGVLYSEELSLSPDQLMYLVLVSPVRNIDQMANARQFCDTVDTALARVKAKHPAIGARRTGFAAVQMDAREAIFNDFGVMMAVTVLGILLVSLLGLKSLDFPLLILIPMTVGIMIMFGAYALFGQLNMVSMMTPIILFGLGIDYAIHFGARYGEVRLELGDDAPQAMVLRGTLDSIGPGMLAAAITTVFAFLSLLVCTISGLLQAGLMAATGVASSFLAMIYLLPILVTWREGLAGQRRARFLKAGRYLRLGRLVNSHAGTAGALALLALALSAVHFIPTIQLERDGMTLSPANLESIVLSKDLEAKFGFTDAQSYFSLKGYDTLKRFRRELARQEDGRAAYPAINTMRVRDARKAIRTFEKLGWDRDIKTLPRYTREYAASTNLLGGSNKHIAQVYAFITRNYVLWEEDTYLVIVPPSGYVWDRDLTDLYTTDLARLEKKFNVTSAGFVQIWKFLVDHLLEDLISSSLVAFGLVLVVLLVITRSVAGTLICSITLLASLAATLSIIGMLRLKLNAVNIIAFPIIIGLGIDYIVHIYYRMVHEEGFDVVKTVASTGKAVLLTTLTTLVAFGAISFSAHRGMAGIGVFSFIGLSVAFLCSLLVVPVMIKLIYRIKT